MRTLYRILIYCLLPLAFLRLAWRSISRKNPAYRLRWSERLGRVPFHLSESIWIHAASVGETLAAQPLIKALRARYPELPIVLTTMTVTGSERVKAIYKDTLYHAYVPYDVRFAARRFLSSINPRLSIMIETELWPTLFAECRNAKIPLMIANARLSEKSARGYQRIASITRELLQAVTVLAVQTDIEAQRFIALGLPKERAVVTGSIKFDMEIPENLPEKAQAFRANLAKDRLIWVAASTHAGEDELVLNVHQQLLKTFPDLLLILVPRHPERFDQVASLVNEKSLSLARRSVESQCPAPPISVYLGDSMGEMLLWYAVCDLAFVGGSFTGTGGHNMLEAALLAKPIIMGPSVFNFAEISQQLIAAKGLTLVSDEAEFTKILQGLLQDPAGMRSMGQRAYAVAIANRGALAKHLQAIDALVTVEKQEVTQI